MNLLKEDVRNVPVWVKLHGVPVTAFSDDGLNDISTKLGTPLMLDSYTSDMCRAKHIGLSIGLDRKTGQDRTKRISMSGSDVTKNLKNPSQAPRGVLVGPKLRFK
ncbi:proteasome subunit alpha type-5 [Tanacetum coccineum]